MKKLFVIIKEVFNKMKQLLMLPNVDEELTPEPLNETLKSVSMKSMVDITELLKEFPIKNVSVGLVQSNLKKVSLNFSRVDIERDESPLVVIKANCETDRHKSTKTMKVEHRIRTIGNDNQMYDLIITTFCKCIVFANDWDMYLIQACNIYCNGLITANHLSDFSRYELQIPDLKGIDLIHKRSYDGYISTYGNNKNMALGGNLDESVIDPLDNTTLKSEEVQEESLKSLIETNSMIMDVIRKSNAS